MKVYSRQFNLFLALALLPALFCGCSMFGSRNEPLAGMRVYMEVAPGAVVAGGNETKTVSVLRSSPVTVTIDKDPVLTEANLVAAKVIRTPDAPAIEVRFDENGTWILEQYTAANPGRHFVIFGSWGKDLKNTRPLAAPLITQRINDGILSFTPDMTLDEANAFVQGLNNVIKQFQTSPSE